MANLSRDEGHKRIAGKVYTESGYSNTKNGAQTRASEIKKKYPGVSVRITKDKGEYVIWSRRG